MPLNIATTWDYTIGAQRMRAPRYETYCRELAFSSATHALRQYLWAVVPSTSLSWDRYSTTSIAALLQTLPPLRIDATVVMQRCNYDAAHAIAAQFNDVTISPYEENVGGFTRSLWHGFQLCGGPNVAAAFFWVTKAARDGLWKESTSYGSLQGQFRRTLRRLHQQPEFIYYLIASGRGPQDTLQTLHTRSRYINEIQRAYRQLTQQGGA